MRSGDGEAALATLAAPSMSMIVAGLSGAWKGGGCRYEFNEPLKDDGQWFWFWCRGDGLGRL